MADARALLKARRQEARISHPFAAYNSTGQLRCSVCGTIVKHASAWEGHLGSKIHRTNVARLKEERQRQELEQREEESRGKRKAGEETSSPQTQKKQRVEQTEGNTSGFPNDFFSDPSRARPVSSGDSDEDEDSAPTAPMSQFAPVAEVDLEYERFQRELLKTESAPQTYDGATVAAEPVLVSMDMDGFPANDDAAMTEAPTMTEGELRAKKEQEERELIMDRLLDEERAQEDADTRVNIIKARFEILKKRREQKGTKGAAKS